MWTARFQQFETLSEMAVTNLIYHYRLIILCTIINLICGPLYRKKNTEDRKQFKETQTKMTVPASVNPEIAMLWQGVILEIFQKYKVP